MRVEPSGHAFGAADGETVMAAAGRHGYRWPTLCQGDGTCTVCWMEVVDGPGHLAPVGDRERAALRAFPARLCAGAVRLACQARVHGDVVVHKQGVRRQAPAAPGGRAETRDRQPEGSRHGR